MWCSVCVLPSALYTLSLLGLFRSLSLNKYERMYSSWRRTIGQHCWEHVYSLTKAEKSSIGTFSPIFFSLPRTEINSRSPSQWKIVEAKLALELFRCNSYPPWVILTEEFKEVLSEKDQRICLLCSSPSVRSFSLFHSLQDSGLVRSSYSGLERTH